MQKDLITPHFVCGLLPDIEGSLPVSRKVSEHGKEDGKDESLGMQHNNIDDGLFGEAPGYGEGKVQISALEQGMGVTV